MRRVLALLLGLLLAILSPMPHEAQADAPRTHTVYAGQRLGSIAKRYNVSVEALCNANGISSSSPIRPGQKLIIPAADDKDGSAARRQLEASRARPQPAGRSAPSGAGKPGTHEVYPGQTLARIAKRYGVSVEALCAANGITQNDPIKPGQVLVIPAPGTTPVPQATPPVVAPPAGDEPPPTPQSSAAPEVHRVYPGHTLGKIAKRYHVTIAALCLANDLDEKDPLKPGDLLVIPTPDDPEGTRARELRASVLREQQSARPTPEVRPEPAPRPAPAPRARPQAKSWKAYQRPPARRGYVTLIGYEETWKGYVIGPKNEVLPAARLAFSRLMGVKGDVAKADWRLVRLLAQVSDTFGGRPIRVVSGYRTESYALNSRHRKSQALDFSIPGVPNEVIRDYLLTFANVGVGYYPNSSFVHFDVRETKTYWVDASGPGEAPQYVR